MHESTHLLDVALMSTRVLSYAMLAYALFFLAMCLGKWYSEEVIDDQFEYVLRGTELKIGDFYNQIVVFTALPVILAAALGGVYEALWKLRESKGKIVGVTGNDAQATGQPLSCMGTLKSILHFQFRPLPAGLSP